jgi:hypothetical protein
MDVKFHWSVGDEKFYWLELLRDQTTPEAIAAKKTEKKQKAAEKTGKDETDAERLEAEIAKNPSITATALHNKLSMNAKRVTRLLETKGWTWNKEAKTWTGGAFAKTGDAFAKPDSMF